MINPRTAIRWSVKLMKKEVTIDFIQEIYGIYFNEWLLVCGKLTEIKDNMEDFKKYDNVDSLTRAETLSKDVDNQLRDFDIKSGKYIPAEDALDKILAPDHQVTYHDIVRDKLMERSTREFSTTQVAQGNLEIIRKFIVNKNEIDTLLSLLWFI